ncbi:MAG: sulfatase-like hydrolase/transferase [Planctomycetota bacterium]|jgi:choline-sulfatase
MQKNILFIVSDQHQAKAMGCAGHKYVKTPNLDKLAEKGILFERAFCTNPLCVPARISLLTGRYSISHGAYSLGATFRDDMVTLPHLFAAKDFYTILTGRMHLVWNDSLHGYENRTNAEPYEDICNCDDWWKRELPQYELSGAFENIGPGEQRHLEYDKMAHASALDFIKNESGILDKPWFMTSCLTIPHEPYRVPEEFYNIYKDMDIDLPAECESENKEIYDLYQSFHTYKSFHKNSPDSERIEKAVKAYYGLVTCTDQMVGELVDALDKTGQLENTIIIYTSDHGEMLGEKGCWHKSVLYDTSAQVPLIICDPDFDKKGIKIKQNVSHVDLFPTFAEYAGLDLLDDLNIDGLNLNKLIAGDEKEFNERGILIEYGDYATRVPIAAYLKGDYKLTVADGFDSVLINTKKDPEEMINLFADPDHKDIREYMLTGLTELWNHEKCLKIIRDSQYSFELIKNAHAKQGLLRDVIADSLEDF